MGTEEVSILCCSMDTDRPGRTRPRQEGCLQCCYDCDRLTLLHTQEDGMEG